MRVVEDLRTELVLSAAVWNKFRSANDRASVFAYDAQMRVENTFVLKEMKRVKAEADLLIAMKKKLHFSSRSPAFTRRFDGGDQCGLPIFESVGQGDPPQAPLWWRLIESIW